MSGRARHLLCLCTALFMSQRTAVHALPAATSSFAAGIGAGNFDCSSDDGTGSNFIANAQAFIKGVCCTQAGETCAGFYPTTCASVSCARALSQAGPPCLKWLAEPGQEFFSAFRTQLQTSVDICSRTPTPPRTILLTDSTPSLTDACGARVVDGRAESQTSWEDNLLLSAPPGMVMEVDVESSWLPPSDLFKIRDGKDRDAPTLATFAGTEKPNAPIVGSGQQLFISLYSNGENEGKAVGLSLLINCQCTTDAACGAHGSCGADKYCACAAGYSGATCSQLDACHGSPCGAHGSCIARGDSGSHTCTCIDGYTGAACQAPPDPCVGVACGAHGTCAAGKCICRDRYKGDNCETNPKPCCHSCEPSRKLSLCMCLFACACRVRAVS